LYGLPHPFTNVWLEAQYKGLLVEHVLMTVTLSLHVAGGGEAVVKERTLLPAQLVPAIVSQLRAL
jgi:hypothetical protein